MGTRFWFLLPLPEQEATAAEPPAGLEPASRATEAGFRILVAEDNAINQRVVSALL